MVAVVLYSYFFYSLRFVCISRAYPAVDKCFGSSGKLVVT